MMKVIFLDNVHPCVSEQFIKKGWTCDFKYTENREEILKIIRDYQGLVLRSRIKIDRAFLEQAVDLKFIGRPGAGLENIDLDYCEERGIQVFRSPEGNRDAVAEHAVGMLLMLFNHLVRVDAEVRQGIWIREGNRGHELKGKTVGIIGYGYMGKAFAQRLSGFDVQILAHDKYVSGFGTEQVKEVSLDELKEKADIISLHLPETPETVNYIDQAFISNCSKPFYLINTARGKAVNTQEMLDGIDNGKILGACLDVLEFESSSFEQAAFENEAFKRLVENRKVVLSPHIAGWTHEAKYKLGHYLAEKIVAAF